MRRQQSLQNDSTGQKNYIDFEELQDFGTLQCLHDKKAAEFKDNKH